MNKLNYDSIIGKKFNRWTVLGFASRKNNQDYYNCICDCGVEKDVNYYRLVNNTSKSCGCYSREVHSELMKKRNRENNPSFKHGLWKTRLFKIWDGMLQRCLNPNDKDYKNYGGRGIRICKTWQNDFKKFYDWSMKNGYRDGLQIDRINNNGGYHYLNCRWTTPKVQGNNRRTNHIVEYKGKKYTLSQLADAFNMSNSLVDNRIRAGWSIEKIVETPVKSHSLFKYNGELKTITELSKICGLSVSILSSRIVRRKWDVEKAVNTPIISTIELTYNGETKTIREWAKSLNVCYGTILYRLNKLKWPVDKILSTPKR